MKKKSPGSSQKSLIEPVDSDRTASRFIAAYRVMLVRDQTLPFEVGALSNSRQAHIIIRKLIEAFGQSDREQFCVVLLNNKNEVIGLNIVSIGAVSFAHVHPREVLKPAILASATAIHASLERFYRTMRDQATKEALGVLQELFQDRINTSWIVRRFRSFSKRRRRIGQPQSSWATQC